MFSILASLYVVPLFISGVLLFSPKSVSRILVIIASVFLSAVSVYLYIQVNDPWHFAIPAYFNEVVATADILLLLYFGWVAIRKKSLLVGLMTILQLGGLIYLLYILPAAHSMQFVVDKLSVFMFLLINIISGIIAVYSLRYIEEEDCSAFRKKYFMSILFWFIAVMNLIVSSDNMEYFFLFFELTTLASFLFIGFRKDEVSVKNAITALWMNQVGGFAILAAIFFIYYNGFGDATFTNLLSHPGAAGILLPVALLSIAALIKGAQMPFSKWLLGAMVAPTPVSALLHSSTMVKIAPFMILRLVPVLKNTPVATVVIALTGFAFVAAAIVALSQDNLKRILAHSTIGLLSLMIMMAAIGTPVTIIASLVLILFHGISKCMLFLNAGVLERVFHLKETSDMDKLGELGPYTSLAVTIGFMSLLLPPFGAFVGKWLSYLTLGAFVHEQRIFGALVIVFVAIGGAVFSLLYFKVMGTLISRTGKTDHVVFEHTGKIYKTIINFLMLLIILCMVGLPYLLTHLFSPVVTSLMGSPVPIVTEGWNYYIGAMKLPMIPLLVAFFLLPVTIVVAMFVQFKHVDRAKEYMCGEKINYSFSSFYFTTDKASPYFSLAGTLFFIAMIIVALI